MDVLGLRGLCITDVTDRDQLSGVEWYPRIMKQRSRIILHPVFYDICGYYRYIASPGVLPYLIQELLYDIYESIS